MNQLVYTRKVAAPQSDLIVLLKQAFGATPLGLFIAAFRSAR